VDAGQLFLARLTERHAADRFSSAEEALHALELVTSGVFSSPPSAPAPAQWPLVAGGLMALASIVLLVAWPKPEAPPPQVIVKTVAAPEPAPVAVPVAKPGTEILVPAYDPMIRVRLSSLSGCFENSEIRVASFEVKKGVPFARPYVELRVVLTNLSKTEPCQWFDLVRLVDRTGFVFVPKFTPRILAPFSSDEVAFARELPVDWHGFELRLGLAQAPDAVFKIDLDSQTAVKLP
jgi:hypothetical protein